MKRIVAASGCLLGIVLAEAIGSEARERDCCHPAAEIFHQAERSNGKIILAPAGQAQAGSYAFRLVPGGRLESGALVFPELTVHDASSFSVKVSADNGRAQALPLRLREGMTLRDVRIELPSFVKGAAALTVDIAGKRKEKDTCAALFSEPTFLLETAPSATRTSTNLVFSRINPWMEMDVKASIDAAHEPSPAITLRGPRNDWLTAAAMLTTTAGASVEVSVDAPLAIKDKISLRIAGQVYNDMSTNAVWDPLMSPLQAQQYGARCLNAASIRFFPLLLLSPETPALLWITVDARGLQSGIYQAKIVISGSDGTGSEIPLDVTITDVELPEYNPLMVFGWQWNSSDPVCIRDMVEHGVNVFWMNHGVAWRNGARFLLFKMGFFDRKPMTDEKKGKIRAELDTIWGFIQSNNVPRECWAVHFADEVADNTADSDVEVARYIKEQRPDTPIYFNPGWGQLADTNQAKTTLDGTIRKIAPYADVWQPYSWHLWDQTGVYDFIKQTGKTFWAYDIYGAAARQPAMGRGMLRTGPITAWRYGLTGFGNFALNAWQGGDPWNHSLGQNYALVYSSDPVPVSSRSYEAYRQGVQEYKRFWLLERRGYSSNRLKQWAHDIVTARKVDDIDRIVTEMDQALEGGILNVSEMVIGDQAGGSGIVVNHMGAINVATNCLLGRHVAAYGELIQNSGSLTVGSQLIVGLAGKGVMAVSNVAFRTGRFVIGCSSNGVGSATVLAGATGEVAEVCFVGGRDVCGTDIGSGRLSLKGGTLKFDSDDRSDVDLYVRYRAENSGELRGWGVVMGPDEDNNTVRMDNNGIVVADGEGVDRDLDFHRVISAANSLPNGLSGTNGWYAVNQGRVLFPRVWISSANSVKNMGEYPTDGAGDLDLVNSVRVALNGAATSTYLRGGVCSADRTDVPAGLPEQGETIGVWCLGLFTHNEYSTKASFTNVSVLFRYDHTRVRDIDTLKLYRHEDGGWRCVGVRNPDGTARIATDAPLGRLTNGFYNIGWFALKAVEL